MSVHYFDDPTPPEPTRQEHLFDIGTVFRFSYIGNQLKAAIQIPVIAL